MENIRKPDSAFWLAVIILLLAAALRIYHITLQSIWFDEAFAWNIVIQDDMFPRISTDTHPPLYYVLLRGWMAVTGDSALALRFFSALVSLMTVAFVYRIGAELGRGRGWQALPALAALLMALSDAEIFLAQEARNYSLYTFFACLSMWFYLRWLRTRRHRDALIWVGATSALAYTHYQGLFIPAIQGVHVLLFLRGADRLRGVGWLALSGVPLLPWFIFVTIPQAQNAIDNSLPFAIPTSWETFLHLRDRYLGAVWALMGGLILLGVGLLAARRTHRAWGDAFLLALWILLPFGVLFFGNLYAPLLTERKLLIIAPAIALSAAVGLATLRPPARELVAVALLVYGVTTVDYYRIKEPWAEISAPALELGRSGDLYMAQVEVGQYPMKYYWERQMPDGAIFTTFPFLGDPTMAPTTDHPTYYTAHLPRDLFTHNQANRSGGVATAWLVFWSRDDAPVQALEAAGYVRTMTITTDHIGNAIDLYRYDYLPDEALTTFDNGLILHAADIDAEALRVDLWWGTDSGVAGDFTTSAALLDPTGRLVAQFDSPPPRPTSSLSAGEAVYDPKRLELAEGVSTLPAGEYTAIVSVYIWTPDGIENARADSGQTAFVVGSVSLP